MASYWAWPAPGPLADALVTASAACLLLTFVGVLCGLDVIGSFRIG